MRMLPVHNSETSKEKASARKIFNYCPFLTKEYKAQETQQLKEQKQCWNCSLNETGHATHLQKTLQRYLISLPCRRLIFFFFFFEVEDDFSLESPL